MLLYISSLSYSGRYSCIAKMKVVFGVIIFAAAALVASSAPTLTAGQLPGIMVDPRQQDYYRDTRSQYQQYVSPCAAAAAAAAAASSPIPSIAPAAYQLNIAPYQGYPQVPQQYGAPHYRSMDMEPEIMSYSDMDHMMTEHVPMARYYAAPAASHPAYVPVASPATSGPVFGVFPNANTGGCNVPLLFSCNPSVVPGHVVHSQAQYNAAADSYRGVEPLAHHVSPENHEEPTVHEHMNPAHESSHAVHQ